VIGVGDVEAEDVEGYVLKRLDVTQDREGKEGKEYGEGCENDKRYVEAAVELQAGAAAAAIGEVLFIIPTHFWGDP
jgi:hypothetical protein